MKGRFPVSKDMALEFAALMAQVICLSFSMLFIRSFKYMGMLIYKVDDFPIGFRLSSSTRATRTTKTQRERKQETFSVIIRNY